MGAGASRSNSSAASAAAAASRREGPSEGEPAAFTFTSPTTSATNVRPSAPPDPSVAFAPALPAGAFTSTSTQSTRFNLVESAAAGTNPAFTHSPQGLVAMLSRRGSRRGGYSCDIVPWDIPNGGAGTLQSRGGRQAMLTPVTLAPAAAMEVDAASQKDVLVDPGAVAFGRHSSDSYFSKCGRASREIVACEKDASINGDAQGASINELDDNCMNNILVHLDATSLARAMVVSKHWSRLVVELKLWRRLCMNLFPPLQYVSRVREAEPPLSARRLSARDLMLLLTSLDNQAGQRNQYRSAEEGASAGRGSRSETPIEEEKERERAEAERRNGGEVTSDAQLASVYRRLWQELAGAPDPNSKLIEMAIAASSTDHPQENIHNTLRPPWGEESMNYWSSKGSESPDTAEWLLYKLCAPLTVIHEIWIQPFQAHFQAGLPVYSAQRVRFCLGSCPAVSTGAADLLSLHTMIRGTDMPSLLANCSWSYVSPEFTMTQKNVMQRFVLPHPVLCVGGALKVELLGRVQVQELDKLYYTCVHQIRVIGRPINGFSCELPLCFDEPGAPSSPAAPLSSSATPTSSAPLSPPPPAAIAMPEGQAWNLLVLKERSCRVPQRYFGEVTATAQAAQILFERNPFAVNSRLEQLLRNPELLRNLPALSPRDVRRVLHSLQPPGNQPPPPPVPPPPMTRARRNSSEMGGGNFGGGDLENVFF